MSDKYTDNFLSGLKARYPDQDEFLQAVEEVVEDIRGDIENREDYRREKLLERMTEPDRIISFRVCWEDDDGEVHVNRGWRVQHSNVIGPYKGGLRFHPTVNESVLKFLAFEQTFKNSLTGLNIGGAKGGSDFDPTDRSDREIMRFCYALMDELHHHIGERVDVPAGDINVGSREIGYLFGHYRRIANNFTGALTGKDIEFGGSHVRLEATGYGLLYFVEQMLKNRNESIKGKRVAISGAGNVAIHAAMKTVELGGRVITLSSRKGYLHCPDGFSLEHLHELRDGKGKSAEPLKSLGAGEWVSDARPWEVECDIALPCATQNELQEDDAVMLVKNGCWLVAEGANMPCTAAAARALQENRVLHAPGKASNAGGVALSALEMGQNSEFSQRRFEELDEQLRSIMGCVHAQCLEFAGEGEDGFVHYRKGANRAAFRRLASSLVSQGIG